MKDIAPELLEKIKSEFDNRMKNSIKIKAFEEILKSGNSNYMVANDYAIEVGEILVDIFKTNISSEILPNGKMYYNIADRLLNDRLKENYNLISEFTKETQTQINQKMELNIKGAKSKVNQNRIDGIIKRVSDEDNYDDISWIMQEPIVNFSQSIVDDVLNTNISLHYDLGLRPRIIRKESGNCCDWCKEIVGKYDYPNVPDDIYKRHRFCRCTVEYDPGDGKRQNVHSKKWHNPDKESEKQFRIRQINDIINSKIEKDKKEIEKVRRKLASELLDKKVNETKIKGVSKHVAERVIQRKLEIEDVFDSINNPIETGEIKYDPDGKPSFKVIGRKVTLYVNPTNGNITTTHKTGTKTLRKILEKKNEDTIK